MDTGDANAVLMLVWEALYWQTHFSIPLLFFSLKFFRIQRFRWELGGAREKPCCSHIESTRRCHYLLLDPARVHLSTFWGLSTATHPLLCLSDKSLSPDTLCRAHVNGAATKLDIGTANNSEEGNRWKRAAWPCPGSHNTCPCSSCALCLPHYKVSVESQREVVPNTNF